VATPPVASVAAPATSEGISHGDHESPDHELWIEEETTCHCNCGAGRPHFICPKTPFPHDFIVILRSHFRTNPGLVAYMMLYPIAIHQLYPTWYPHILYPHCWCVTVVPENIEEFFQDVDDVSPTNSRCPMVPIYLGWLHIWITSLTSHSCCTCGSG
jgi:hypothetical protein